MRVHWGRALLLAAAITFTPLAIWLLASPGGGSHPSVAATTQAAGRGAKEAPTTTTTVPPTTTTKPPPTTTTTIDPGTLPQTTELPTAGTPQFNSEMAALWQGIVSNSVQPAMPAFFPESAYVQLKQIGNPQGDYTGRLVAEYGMDISAAHSLLGPDPTQAQLTGVTVDESYAHWVPPGTCDNGIGYYEVPNSRLVYQLNGQTQSFGIASMISWRGVWYVVHLGAVVRSSEQGVVDDPESGPGTPAYSGTC